MLFFRSSRNCIWQRLLKGAFLVLVPLHQLSPQTAAAAEHLRLGALAMRNNQTRQAVEEFQQAVASAPGFAEAYLNLGLAEVQAGDFQPAVAALSKARSLKPGLKGANLFYGIACYRTGSLDEAARALEEQTRSDPQGAEGWLWQGLVELAQNKPVRAAASLDHAAALKPDDVDILYHRGRAHLLVSKQSYQQMFSVAPDSWRVHQVLAEAFETADRLPEAKAETEAALQIRPDEPALYAQLGDIERQLGQYEQAAAAYRKQLSQDPSNGDALYKLGVVELVLQRPDQALPLLIEAHRLAPESPQVQYELGRTQAQLGQDDEALKNLEAVVGKAEVDAVTRRQSYYHLSHLYQKHGRAREAQAALQQFALLKRQADAEQQQKLEDKMKRQRSRERSQP